MPVGISRLRNSCNPSCFTSSCCHPRPAELETILDTHPAGDRSRRTQGFDPANSCCCREIGRGSIRVHPIDRLRPSVPDRPPSVVSDRAPCGTTFDKPPVGVTPTVFVHEGGSKEHDGIVPRLPRSPRRKVCTTRPNRTSRESAPHHIMTCVKLALPNIPLSTKLSQSFRWAGERRLMVSHRHRDGEGNPEPQCALPEINRSDGQPNDEGQFIPNGDVRPLSAQRRLRRTFALPSIARASEKPAYACRSASGTVHSGDSFRGELTSVLTGTACI